ncbi:MAG: hypothetical protein V3U89_06550 [Methylophilaceae bacterium]
MLLLNNSKSIAWLFCSIFLVTASVHAEESKNEANQEVLDAWQEVSGQSGEISEENDGTIEWHGQATQDIYHVDVESSQPGNTLSGLDEGNFSTTRLQGDLRYNEVSGAVNYIQGGVSLSNDEALQSLYRSQVTNIQFGRVANDYQLAAGDVVADFSKIGSSLGLRGLYASKQKNAFTVAGYAGTVATSWESLFNRSTITGQPARNQYLRDVIGTKVSYAVDQNWSVFGTGQTFSDRESSLDDALSAFTFSESGVTGTAGVSYQDEKASFSVELGTSRVSYDAEGADDASDTAVIVDAAYAWQQVNVQAGYHHLGTRYTSLSQNVLSGVREGFVSGQWFITPNLTYGGDVRHADSRISNIFDQKSPLSSLYSLTNWLTYSVSSLPGLSVSVQDTRNWGNIKGVDAKNQNSRTELSTSYANQHYSASIALSNQKEKNRASSLSNSTTDGVQVSLGRQILTGELLMMPTVSGNAQLYGGYQQQRIANGTETTTGNQGVAMNMGSKNIGQWQVSLTNQDTSQPNGAPTLNTKSIYFDWTKVIAEVFSIKAYLSNNYINHGDSTKRVDEKTFGLQGDYQW